METETETETEKWRTIPEFPNYVISNHGRVASKKGRILKGPDVKLHRDGYNARRNANKLMRTVWQAVSKS